MVVVKVDPPVVMTATRGEVVMAEDWPPAPALVVVVTVSVALAVLLLPWEPPTAPGEPELDAEESEVDEAAEEPAR